MVPRISEDDILLSIASLPFCFAVLAMTFALSITQDDLNLSSKFYQLPTSYCLLPTAAKPLLHFHP